MNKIMSLLAVLLIGFCTTVIAQPPGGGDMAAMKERQIKMLKESDLKLTDAQADSVVSIRMEFMQQMRGMRDLEPEDRQAKMKVINEAIQKRLATALKDEALAKKVMEFQREQQQKMRQQGGGRPGGN